MSLTSTATSTSQSEETPNEPKQFSPSEFPQYGYKLPVKPRSATNMWEVWFGIGPYQNQPVRGGIPTMEKEYAGWRKMYVNSEQKQFLRWQSAINLMTEEIAVHGGIKKP